VAGGVPIARFEGLNQRFEDFEAGLFEGVGKAVEFWPAYGGHFEDGESTVCFAGVASCGWAIERIENSAWHSHQFTYRAL